MADPPIDAIEKSIGSTGLFQVLLFILVSSCKLPIAWHQMAIIFLAPQISYQCGTGTNTCPCANPVYNKTIFTNSIQMQWNLICDRKWLASLSQTIFMTGTLFGSTIFGMLSDRFGRRYPLIAAIILQTTAGVAAAYVPEFWQFNFLRLVVGSSVGGTMVVSFVILMEFCGTKYRPLMSALYQVPFNMGHISLAAFGYYFRNYSDFQMAISVPVGILITYICLLPETPRWFIAMSRVDDSVKVCERAAKINRLPTAAIKTDLVAFQAEAQKHHLKKGTLVDLFRTPNLRKNLLCMAFNWLSCSYCFYGVSQYISHLTGDIFMNVAVSATIVLMGTFVSIPFINFLGRKTLLLSTQATCAACLYILATLPEGYASKFFACIGNVAAFVAFILVYLYCSELFPTVVRNSAIGFSSMAARIGSMIAPFVIDLKDISPWLPPVVFAIVPTMAAVVALCLPETKNCLLMTTLEEGEAFGRKPAR